jgi:hypothetical protein
MEPQGSLPCSQEPATGNYPEPHASGPHPQTLMSIRSIVILNFHLPLKGVGLGLVVIGVGGSNPARGMDVCLCVSVLCCHA